MKAELALLLLSSLYWSSNCLLGVDVSQLFTTSTYTCIKNAGYHFAVVRGYCSFGGLDHNAAANLKDAKAAGL